MSDAELRRMLDDAASRLSEHFSSVQIVSTELLPSGGTQWRASGSGDWYARKAACQEFVERDQAQTVALTIKDVSDPSE